MPRIDISKPVLQAEIRPGVFEINDGNHRIKKACRNDVEFVDSNMIMGEQLVAFFADVGINPM